MMTNDEQWLQELKAGDEVVTQGRVLSITHVKAVIGQVIWLDGNVQYSRKTGFNNSKRYPSQMFQATDELRDKIEAQRLSIILIDALMVGLPLTQLRQIKAVLDAGK